MANQLTLQNDFTISGKGLHTGLHITARFCPAPANTGYVFVRTDLEDKPSIEALADNVHHTERGTVLEKNGVQVSTIEHAMAALWAAGIDNCLIEINGPEMPILDGSAIDFVQAIEKAGKEEQSYHKQYYVVRNRIEVSDPETGSSLIILPYDGFSVTTLISYPSSILSNQFARLNALSDFASEVADSRTFVFVREVELLLKHNLIKGGDLDNALVIYDQEMSQEKLDQLADTMHIPHKLVNKLGYINNKPLKYDNEPARHKLMDLMGDLALIGKPLKGHIIATRPGHNINNKMARLIRKDIKRQEIQAPVYNADLPPVMDNIRIKQLLPHRWPFQLVDKVIEISERHVVGIKNVTGNEQFFIGHFPDEPVMPGVLQIEAMAQTGGLLILNTVPDPERYSTYFLKIENVKFRQKVVPGDTLIFRLDLMDQIRRGIVSMKGYAFVGDKIVTEAEFMAQVVKNK
ncbi:MAG: bifunctional UDP-3-O-[3-hydroxymyristoyl] N-acetylglucosamine deacetylase/3-hydroxyacyl-ACP dehydratase [Bacteroidales bacterium]|jgi:UDP-3-O-[3-hydroxymyristoyl] N-acetylglucosamine deacetylase / 3-hydroxyacyl-[acyl-carrier-protein] dehydratase|nr:bifunctional UDP-3-O-[3-hydroxymyristoyl] N-acetylglucosamine deacetylase/3-hydroxyacyl-ACP dehydratase [Bacteroidales bacterium]